MTMHTILRFNHRYWILLTAIVLVAVTALSLWPLDKLPPVPGSDKTHHFMAYTALMLPAALRQPRYVWVLALVFVAYGGLIELLQPYANRYGEWLDFAANSGGVGIGALLGKRLSAYHSAYNNPPSL